MRKFGAFFFGPPGIIGNWCHRPSRFYESVAQCPCGLNVRKLLRLFAFCCLSDEKRLRAAGRSIVATGDIRARLKLGADTAVASSHVRLLGVYISLYLSVDRHVFRVCAGCFCRLRQLRRRPIRRSLDSDSLATLTYVVVNSRMDYCHSVLADAPRTITDKLQRALNAAARYHRHSEV